MTQLKQEPFLDIVEAEEEKPRDLSNPKSHASDYKQRIRSIQARVDCWNKSAERKNLEVTPPAALNLGKDTKQALPFYAQNNDLHVGSTEFI